jgi:hypothetical protein
MPGIGLLMLGAVQHAPQFGLHCMISPLRVKTMFSTNRILSVRCQNQRHFASHEF